MKILKTKRRQKIDRMLMKQRYKIERECRDIYDEERMLRDEKFENEKRWQLNIVRDDYVKIIKDLKNEHSRKIDAITLELERFKLDNESMKTEYKEFRALKDKSELISRRLTEMIAGLTENMNQNMSILYQEFAIIQGETEKVSIGYKKKKFRILEANGGD